MSVLAIIPAFNPGPGLVAFAGELVSLGLFSQVVIVNDGSKPECMSIFEQLKVLDKVTVLAHAINRGKGCALKTGFNYAACEFPQAEGVVTIDADGQHLVEDAAQLAREFMSWPEQLIIGVREFASDVPFRSRVGNKLTRIIMRYVGGIKVQDTQSGLRAIPMSLIKPLLKVADNGYEFELEMLLLANKLNYKLRQLPINTIYIEGNARSHFKPLTDSLKIYFVLFRFAIIALLSAGIDYAVFLLMFYFVTASILTCFITARVVSMLFNYINVRRYAFHSNASHSQTAPKYICLAAVSGSIAYAVLQTLVQGLGLAVVLAKLLAEFVMFVINFLVQRDLIF